MDPSRRVVLVAFDGLQSLDLIGPNEVFSAASRLSPGAYSVSIGPRQAPSVLCASMRTPLQLANVRDGATISTE